MTTSVSRFIPYGLHHLEQDDIDAVVSVLQSKPLTQGDVVEEFERALAQKVGAQYAVACSNGTAALHLAYLAAGVGRGDIVLTTPNTFVATSNGALYVGAQPVFCDIDSNTLNISPEEIKKQIAQHKKVKAIVPVHFAGNPCEMSEIKSIADATGAVVIEDAAHALGGHYKDGGTIGNCRHSSMTTFSFHPVKHVATGEGGAVTTNDKSLYERLRIFRNHGIEKNPASLKNKSDAASDGQPNPWYYEMQQVGFNYRLTDIQSALGVSQLQKLDRFNSRRRELVQAYDQAFQGMKNLKSVQLAGRNFSAHHLYVVRINFEKSGLSRQKVMAELNRRMIGTQVHYIPVYRQPAYASFGFKPNQFPQTESYYAEALSLPLFYSLTNEEQKFVIDSIREILP